MGVPIVSAVLAGFFLVFAVLEYRGRRVTPPVFDYGTLVVHGLIAANAVFGLVGDPDAVETVLLVVTILLVAGAALLTTLTLRREGRREAAEAAADGGGARESDGRKHSPAGLALLTAAGFAVGYTGRFLAGSDAVSQPVAVLVMLGGIVIVIMAGCFAAADWMRASERSWQRDRSSS